MINENNFIIGIDLGNLTSTVSYFDFNQMGIDVVDISGGYGKVSVPTVVSYNIDTEDWVFGEYAILNKGFGNDIIIENIIENLGKGIMYTVKGKSISLTLVLSKFILFLIENIKNINPNANIEGIVLSTSSYTSSDDIKEAFKLAGIEHLLLKISNDKECILKSYFYENDVIGDKVLIIDYSNRQIRASIYQIEEDGKIKCLKTIFNDNIGQQRLFNITKNLITKKFLEETGKIDLIEYEKNNIDSFVYQQFDIIFQRQTLSDIKLYYNFFYPPFQKVILRQELFDIISFFENEINIFFNSLFDNIHIKVKQIKNNIFIFVNDFDKTRFEPFVYKGNFIWQKFDKKIFLINKDKIIDIEVYLEENKRFKTLEKIKIDLNNYDEFVNRDIKTIRFLMYAEFKNYKELIFNIEDFGFGEIYPKTSFKQQFIINIQN